MHRLLIAAAGGLLLSACSWVALEPGAADVLVLPAERLTDKCESLGKVTVSVLEKVGVLARHEEEVVEDLDTLARNHAVNRNGDTVVPLGPVANGARQYEVYRCTDAGATTPRSERERPDDNVEVLPYDGGSDEGD